MSVTDNRQRESTSPPEEPPSEPPRCDIWAGIYLDHGAMRFRGSGRLEDLKNAISDYQKASRDVCRSTVFRKLEAALEVRLEKAAELRPNDRLQPIHHYKLRDALLECFERFTRLEDLESEISSLWKSVEFSLDGHPDNAIFLGRLKHAPDVCASHLASPGHLEGSISTLQNAAGLMPPNKLTLLDHFGHALEARFHRLDNPEDLASLTSTLRNAVELTPDNHPDKITLLNNLENGLVTCFHLLSDLGDLDNAISDMWIAVGLTPESDPDKSPHTTLLDKVSTCLPQSVSDPASLESATPTMQTAIECTPDNHPERLYSPIILGDALQARFSRLDTVTDMERAISSHQRAVDLTPDYHLVKLSRLMILRDADMGHLGDLDNTVPDLRKSIRSLSDGHPDRPFSLPAIGMMLQTRLEWLGKFEDLKSAILSPRIADELTEDDYPDEPLCHYSLGDTDRVHFECLGKPEVLETAISRLQKSVEFTPDGDLPKPTYLNGLGRALLKRFGHCGRLEDLECAMSSLAMAVKPTPDGHSRRLYRLRDLERALLMCVKHLNKPEHLEESILILDRACEPTPDGHLDKPNHLSDLGAAVLERYERGGIHADLEKATSIQEEADALMPDQHTGEPFILGNTGKAPRASYECARKLDDLNATIPSPRKAAGLTPNDYPDNQKRLITLVVELQERFKRVGGSRDLDSLVSSLQKAVAFMEDGHPVRPICFNTLGKALKTRYERIGSLEDLDGSISSLQQAVALFQESDPYKAYRLDSLGSAYSLSFSRRDRREDLQKALSIQENAVKLTPSGHPNESKFLINFGDALYASSNSLGNRQHRKLAVDAYAQAAKSPVGQPRKCFEAALKWAQCCRDSSESPLQAYTRAISLLPRIAPLGLSVTDQHALGAKVGGVVRDAVAAAIEDKKYVMALEWAEHGRSIVWQILLSLGAPLDDLRLIYPELADRLQEVSQQIETPFGDAVLGSEQVAQSSEEVAHTHLELAVERDKLLKEIRSRSNFESFLRPKTFDKLKAAARDGTVVILNVQDSRCDALALISDEHGVSVKGIPLKRFSYQTGRTLLQDLRSVLSSPEVRVKSLRGYRLPKYGANSRTGLDDILRILWLDVVKPVMQGLKYEVELANPPHIWWCPTGPLAFLPIHAAGLYDADGVGEKISDYVVSSYTPTLTAMLRQERSIRGPFHLLTVALPWTPNAPPLPYTKEEVGRIQSIATGLSLVELRGKNATMKRVVDEMKISDWVHFACHGDQGIDNALTSGLLLHDKKLELSEMIKMSLPKADFAFLSACQTATGDEMVAEESVHLASGMLFAGYRGLIATMWSINDKDAPQVAEDVYRQILKDGKPNRKGAARALHQAVKRLREKSKGDLRS